MSVVPLTSYEALASARLVSHGLVTGAHTSAVDVVGSLGAVQAQDYAEAKWALGVRIPGSTEATIAAAFDRGDILRTHVLRPTWHFVLPADIRWMLALTAPRVLALSKTMHRKVDLTEAVLRRGVRAIAKALRGGEPRTRGELATYLEAAGIDTTAGRLTYLVMFAELEAVICSGPRRGRQFTYLLLDERVPATPGLTRAQALAELGLRFFTSHGPARAQDFAWWSGLTLADAKVAAAQPRLASVEVDGVVYVGGRDATTAPKPALHLLPGFDECMLTYRDRRVALDPAVAARRGADPYGLTKPQITWNGQVIGGWQRTLGKTVHVAATMYVPFSRSLRLALEAAVTRYGEFLDCPVTLTVGAP